MTTELIVAILVFATAVLGLLKAVVEKKKEVVHRHDYKTLHRGSSGCGCFLGLLFLVAIALVVAVALDIGALRQLLPPEWLPRLDEGLKYLKIHK